MSTIDVPTLAGSWPGCPFTDMRPLYACISESYPGRWLRGPRAPKAVIEQ
jgi:hypothetical protein